MADTELIRIAQEYADLFNQNQLAVVERLIADACIDPYWDGRTNLLALVADTPEDLGLVLAAEPDGDEYVVVRFIGEWVVDCSPVDWEELEDEALEPQAGSRPGSGGMGGIDHRS